MLTILFHKFEIMVQEISWQGILAKAAIDKSVPSKSIVFLGNDLQLLSAGFAKREQLEIQDALSFTFFDEVDDESEGIY